MTTAADARRLELLDEMLAGFTHRLVIRTYDDFVKNLYDHLRRSISSLENYKHYIEHEGEDATTARIIMFLEGAGFKARQQAAGGNVDIYVDDLSNNFKWVGEAKKYESVTNIADGFKQLATRYAHGTNVDGKGYGALIAYLRRPNSSHHVQEWKQTIANLPEATNVRFSQCPRMTPFAFISEHDHQSTGNCYETWHICVQLLVDPKDKSGVNSKAGKARAKKATPPTSDNP
jgi:hypothetical protein